MAKDNQQANSTFLGRFGLNKEILAISFARMSDSIGNGLLIVLLPLYIAQLDVSWLHVSQSIQVGIVLSVFGLITAFAQPLAGALTDRTGRQKEIIIGGLLLMGLSILMLVFVDTYEWLILIRILQGIGLAATIPASITLLTLATEKNRRGQGMGFYTTFRVLGFSIGPLLGGAAHDYLGFQTSFYISMSFVLAGAILVLIWVHNKEDVESKQDPAPFRIIDKKLLTPGLLGLGFATFVMASSFSMILTLENKFNARLDQTAFAFGAAISALMISRILLQMPFGWLSDRIGRKSIIITGLFVMAAATYLLGIVENTLQLTLVRVLQGIGSAGVAAPAFALGGDLTKSGGRGRQLSVLTIGFGLGIAMGPLLTGFLVGAFFQLPFIFFALLLLAGAWIVHHFVPETVTPVSLKRLFVMIKQKAIKK